MRLPSPASLSSCCAVVVAAILLAPVAYAGDAPPPPSAATAAAPRAAPPAAPTTRVGIAWRVPPESSIPAGPLGDAVRLGRSFVVDTQRVAKAYVGNGLTCANCHLGGGTKAYAGPFVGLWGIYPEYSARDGRVISLAERVNECMTRSMNGKPLPRDAPEMIGVEAYVAWLSMGVATGRSIAGRGYERLALPATAPDAARGRTLYAARCAACHGADGQGTPGADGLYAFPPLWGPASFNDGAGMARLGTAASFVMTKMPLGDAGSLSERDAYDIASFVTREPRPAYAGKARDWPRGRRPADARD